MSIRKVDRLESFEDVKAEFQHLRENIGLDDLRPSGTREDTPAQTSLDKGRFSLAEINGVPYIYYRALSGTLYKKQMDVA